MAIKFEENKRFRREGKLVMDYYNIHEIVTARYGLAFCTLAIPSSYGPNAVKIHIKTVLDFLNRERNQWPRLNPEEFVIDVRGLLS